MVMHRVFVGLVKEIRPLPLVMALAPLVLSLLITHTFPPETGLFFTCTFFLLYTVHLLDTYEDAFVRKEDSHKHFKLGHGSEGELTESEVKIAALISSLIFFLLLWGLVQTTSFLFLVIVLVGFGIGVLYSSFFSKYLLTSLLIPPLDVVLGMAAAFLLARGTTWSEWSLVASAIFFLMLGAKAWLDIADKETDAKTQRKNIALVWGEKKARKFALGCLLLGVLSAFHVHFSFAAAMSSIIAGGLFLYAYSLPTRKSISILMPTIFFFVLWMIVLYILPVA